MIEIPESTNLRNQLNSTLKNKTVASVLVMKDPHKFAFTFGDPAEYPKKILRKTFTRAQSFGGWVEMSFGDAVFMVSDGTRLYYTEDKNTLPKKHQMLFRFDDDSYLCASIQMYGGLICSLKDTYDDKYYLGSKEKPEVLSDEFDESYFMKMASDKLVQKKSIKAFLATEQRIPGFGNGVLHDVLFNAKVHHKTKISMMTEDEIRNMFFVIKSTLTEMTEQGGRDTEKDLFGNECGYRTKMSKNTVGTECPDCDSVIEKASYMGGSIYFCPTCQPVKK